MTWREWLRRITGGTASPPVTDPDDPTPPAQPGDTTDVPYGPDARHRLDVYPGNGPALVVVHGGSWRDGDKALRGIVTVSRKLAAKGYCVFSINYRLVVDGKPGYPMQHEDVLAAAEWVRLNGSQYGADTSRLFLLGGSAGGHLAALAGTVGTGFAGVVSLSGPLDFVLLKQDQVPGEDRLRGSVPNYLGCRTLADCPQSRLEEASPAYQVTGESPRFLIVNGATELVPATQAQAMNDVLTAHGVESELLIVAGSGHAMKNWDAAEADVFAFLAA